MGDFNAGPNLEFHKRSGAKTTSTVKKLWNDKKNIDQGLLGIMRRVDFQLISQVTEDTWSRDNNKLVIREAAMIATFNMALNPSHRRDWEESNSVIDHIFSNKNYSVIFKDRVFDKPVEVANCGGRYETPYYTSKPRRRVRKDLGRAHLSDHFGSMVVVDL